MKCNNILEAVGHTPLVRLNRINKGLKPQIYVKAEFTNPGGSVKDRIGISMIDEAEWEKVGRAHGEFFGEIRPATSMVEVSKLIAPEMLVEIEADAIVE